MKYIRTKDAYEKEIIALFDDRPVEKGGNILKFSQKSIVLRNGIVIKRTDFDNSKQAGTIEELCDEFVVLDNRPPKTKRLEKDFDKSFRWFNHCKISKQDIIIYGAIWTDKGLIYVAKMNNKGELELLWKYISQEKPKVKW